MTKWEERIRDKKVKVGVLGLGYVGLPLVREFAAAGLKMVGFDIDEKKVKTLNAGRSIIKHIPHSQVKKLVRSGLFTATSNMARLKTVDAILVCVPTPLTINREPDMQYIIKSSETIAKYLQKKQLVVFESTTYPGTTRELVVPILEKSGLKAGRDFYLAYSPEREDPGNKDFSTKTIAKVVGGLTKECLGRACELYNAAIDTTVAVSSLEAAEAAKILENVYRCINIAMVNELKMVFDRMDIDIWEVIRAASTKPFGFKAFYPGPYIAKTHKQRRHDLGMISKKLSAKMLGSYDAVLISTDHSCYDYKWIVKNAKLIIDTRNATAGVRSGRGKIVKA